MNINQLNLTLADIEAQLLRRLSEMSGSEDEMDGEDEDEDEMDDECDCEDPDDCDCEDEED
jgi:hypothetical protein